MTTVYLHIGLPKTGTTAIQNFLTDNADALSRRGICFPDVGLRFRHISWRRNAHFLIASYVDRKGKKHPRRPCAEYESTLDQIAALAEQYDTIILSDEAIWENCRKRPDFWPSLKQDFRKRGLALRIIAYLRRQDSFVESLYRQRVKSSWLTADFHGYLQKLRFPLDYYSYISTLAGVFGRENIFVRIYDRERYRKTGGTVFSDFLDIFGLSPADGFESGREIRNTSMQGSLLELRRIVNSLPDIENALILNKSIKTVPAAPGAGLSESVPLFTPEERRAFLDSFAASNERLAREFLNLDDGLLFCGPSEQPPSHSADTNGLLRDTILVYGRSIQISEQKIQWLKGQILELQQQNGQLRKELRELREDVLWYRLKRKIRNLKEKNEK